MKYSRDLLELRDKEAKLVRVKRYEEAEKIKMKADLLEEFERNKLEAEVSLDKHWLLLDVSCAVEKRGQVATYLVVGVGSFAKTNLAWPKRATQTSSTGQSAFDLKKQKYS